MIESDQPPADHAAGADVCTMAGTAPAAHRAWLLVEHPGPWPAFGLPPDLPPGLAALLATAPEMRVRPQLIRRPLRRAGRQSSHRSVLVAYADPFTGHGGLLGRALAWEPSDGLPHDLTAGPAGLDLAALAAGRLPAAASAPDHAAAGCAGRPAAGVRTHPAGWRRLPPILLVCTHGRREPCCARFGRPTAVALAHAFPDRVWETTHVGGDAFAANLVTLPSGLYHGRLTPADAVQVGAACLRGEAVPAHFRGRCGLTPTQQAALRGPTWCAAAN